jgi:NitT/TauT family transport system substrate-binding protein
MHRKSIGRLTVSAALALMLFAWAPAVAQQGTGQNASSDVRQKVLVRFTWKLKAEYVPLFVALDKGYYAAEGLDVQLAEGSGPTTVVKVIAIGTEQFGYGAATVIADAVSRDLPVQVVAVYQPRAPIALVSFPDVPLNTPKDLEGRKLGLVPGETFGNLLQTFGRINNFDHTKVTVLQMELGALTSQFLLRKIDYTTVYVNNTLPMLEKQTGVKLNAMPIADFGLKVLGASLFVNSDFARKNPETVRKLLRATAKGYAETARDPKGATDILEKYLTIKPDRRILEQQVIETARATPVIEGRPIGWQSEADWRDNLELLKATDAVKEIKDLRFYYTNDYLLAGPSG